jgi:putative ABC transport system permease protein
MELWPIIASMRRNKIGAILISVQIAVTLAILCNGLFIVRQRLQLSQRPTGTEEESLIAVSNQWVGNPEDLSARLQTDLATLRALPGVADAYSTDSYPLSNSGWSEGVDLKPDQKKSSAATALYFADTHTIATLGVRLVAGRNFNDAEIQDRGVSDRLLAPGIIVTRALAEQLFPPPATALGQSVFLESRERTTPIIGVIDKLQAPWTLSSGFASRLIDNSVLVPFRFVAKDSLYVVRAKPGMLGAVMRAIRPALFGLNRARVVEKVESFPETRAESYRNDRGLAVILLIVCSALLAVTAFGIVGLTSYWVSQRRRMIGIRRALGATRNDILRYFQVENALIAAVGVVVGAGMTSGINLWMVTSFEMARLDPMYVVVGAVVMVVLGQCAALWPALRAASIPPALATRSG